MKSATMFALVTGATDGIGLETARELTKKGLHVIVHGRSREKVERVRKELSGSGVVADLASLGEVRSLARDVRDLAPKIHVLINNAGVFMQERALTVDGYETTFAVNHLAPFLLTHLLLDPLEGGRVVNVSSIAHTRGRVEWDNLQGERRFDGYDAYARSKLANVLFTLELARRVGPRFTVNALHPGVVGTKLLRAGFGMSGSDSLREGAATSVFLATSPDVSGKTGGYYVRSALTAPSKDARDPEIARRLFDLSAQMTGL